MATAKSIRESLATKVFVPSDNPFKTLDELVGVGNWKISQEFTEPLKDHNAISIGLNLQLTIERNKKEITEADPDTTEVLASDGMGYVVWTNSLQSTHQMARKYAIFDALVQYGASFIPDPDPKPEVKVEKELVVTPVVSQTPDPVPAPTFNQAPRPILPSASKPGNIITCGNPDNNAQCMGILSPYTGKPKPDGTPGKFMSVATQSEMTTKKYGVPLCKNCNSFRFMQEKGYIS